MQEGSGWSVGNDQLSISLSSANIASFTLPSPTVSSARVEATFIIDAIAHPNAGLLPDTFHMSIEEADMGKARIQAGPHTAHVHLGDSNRLLPGHGLLNWPDIFGALNTVGYDGYVNLECSTTGDPAVTLPATAASLRVLAQS